MRTVVADAVAPADDGRRGRDRVAHRGPRGRADRAAARAWSDCRPSTSSGRAASIITMCRSRSAMLRRRRDRMVRPRALGGAGRGRGHGSRAGDRSRVPALSAWCARAAFAVRYVARSAGRARAPRDYGLALAVEFARGVPRRRRPGSLERAACATPSAINWLALAVIGGLGSRARRAIRQRRRWRVRLACSAARRPPRRSALFLWIEPRCLRGPYAMMDPAVWPIWLAHVREMQPLLALTGREPAHRRSRSRRSRRRRSWPPSCCCAIRELRARSRLSSSRRAALLRRRSDDARGGQGAIPTRPGSACRWSRLSRCICSRCCGCSQLLPRVAVGLLLTPAVLSLGAITIAECGRASAHGDSFNAPKRSACFKTAKLCGACAASARPGRGRHRLRAVPAGADAARGAGRALSPAVRGHRRRRTRSSPRRPMRAQEFLARERATYVAELRTGAPALDDAASTARAYAAGCGPGADPAGSNGARSPGHSPFIASALIGLGAVRAAETTSHFRDPPPCGPKWPSYMTL